MQTPKKEQAKEPFRPYDLTKSPPKPLKLRKSESVEQSLTFILQQKGLDLKALLAENDYLPLEPFCSGEYDFVSTEDWLKKLKNSKTLTAQRFDLQKMRF